MCQGKYDVLSTTLRRGVPPFPQGYATVPFGNQPQRITDVQTRRHQTLQSGVRTHKVAVYSRPSCGSINRKSDLGQRPLVQFCATGLLAVTGGVAHDNQVVVRVYGRGGIQEFVCCSKASCRQQPCQVPNYSSWNQAKPMLLHPIYQHL